MPGEVNWIHLEGRDREFLFTWDGRGKREPYGDVGRPQCVWWVNESTGKFNLIPKIAYDFWSKIYDCKTWGEVRSAYDRGFYRLVMELMLKDAPSTKVN
ncbi:hypothetical protein ACHAXT_012110 [Thalassiosira profunda]